jgi:hypothetical protein
MPELLESLRNDEWGDPDAPVTKMPDHEKSGPGVARQDLLIAQSQGISCICSPP